MARRLLRFLVGRQVRWLRRRRAERQARRNREAFYGRFVKRGELCFDIGANIGNRVATFLAIGARVVAVEPQSACQTILRQQFGRNDRFTLVGSALGSAPGKAQLRAAEPESPMATLSADWLDRVRESKRFGDMEWSLTEDVTVQTLDTLVAEFGPPSFCKIDVEGHEHAVLLGLSRPVAALSLEFTPEHLDAARNCVRRLQELGDYEFNYSLAESFVFALSEWVSGEGVLEALAVFEGNPLIYGDIYARLRSA